MDEEVEAARSPRFRELSTLAESARHDCADFDPAVEDAETAIEEGIEPLVEAYVACRRDDVELSAVERSLLAGALNDWLRAYAKARGLPAFEGTAFSVHEIAMEYARAGDLETGLERLLEP